MNTPISILFPCYLINPWLDEALKSIEKSAKDMVVECIIVANNMSEETIDVLQNLCRKILTIDFKIVNAGKTDLVGALNFGLANCKYEFIARFDQDDVMIPNRLKLQSKFLESHPDHSLVGGAVEIITEEGCHIGLHKYPQSPESIERDLLRGNCFAHPAVMYRKSKVLEVGGYSSIFAHAEDFDLFIKLNKVSKSSNLQETLIKYRQNKNQVSNNYRMQQVVSTRALILMQHIEPIKIEFNLPLPCENSDLEDWVELVKRVGRGGNLFNTKLDKNTKQIIRKAIAHSHIAIARSTGYKGNRNWSQILIELFSAFIWSPTVFLLEISRALKPHK